MLTNDNPNPNTNPPGPLRVEGFDDVPPQALRTPTNELDQFLPGPSFSGGAVPFIEEEAEEGGVAGGLNRKLQLAEDVKEEEVAGSGGLVRNRKLQLAIGITAAGGRVTISGNPGRRVRYTPPDRNPTFTGRDIAIYTACDVNGLCNSAFIFIEVRQESPTFSPTLAPNFP